MSNGCRNKRDQEYLEGWSNETKREPNKPHESEYNQPKNTTIYKLSKSSSSLILVLNSKETHQNYWMSLLIVFRVRVYFFFCVAYGVKKITPDPCFILLCGSKMDKKAKDFHGPSYLGSFAYLWLWNKRKQPKTNVYETFKIPSYFIYVIKCFWSLILFKDF